MLELRVNGTRPGPAAGRSGGNYRGTIQLTNPERIDRNLEDKVRPEDDLAGASSGSRASGLIGAGSRSGSRSSTTPSARRRSRLELELDADAADIFEVRGGSGTRAAGCPIAIRRDRVTFRYDGLDGRAAATHLAFSEPSRRRRR